MALNIKITKFIVQSNIFHSKQEPQTADVQPYYIVSTGYRSRDLFYVILHVSYSNG